MARELTYKVLCETLATKCGLSEKKVERVLKNFILLMASELQNNSYINVNNLGKFTTELRGGSDEWFETSNGKMKKKYVKPFNYITYNPSQNLLDVINGEPIKFLFDNKKSNGDEIKYFEDLVEENTRRKKSSSAESKEEYFEDVKKYLKKRKEKTDKPKERYGKHVSLKSHNDEISYPVLCLNNNTVYPSVYTTAQQLKIPVQRIYNRIKKYGNGVEFDVCGYQLKIIKEEKGKEKDEM